MRYVLAALALLATPAAAKDPDFVGRYRLSDGPDIAGQLELTKDGRFGYALAAGALDERAQGRWELKEAPDGKKLACLTTEPAPKAPEFQRAEPISGDGATIRVTWPPHADGTVRGIAGVNFTLGFDSGEPLQDYTQDYGWTLPPDERRVPRWIELTEPIHRIKSGRLPLAGRFHAVLVPNDIGVVNFQGACLSEGEEWYSLRRSAGDGLGGEMKFIKVKA